MLSRSEFEREFKDLQMELLKMASLVEESISRTMIALKKQDATLAKDIFMKDDVIDDLEIKIEIKCLQLMTSLQPLPEEVRSISAALKIITDMERIADHASDIAELTVRMHHEKYIKPLIDIPKMGDLAKDMVKKAIDSYLKKDENLAQQVCNKDDAVDELYYKVLLEISNLMKNDPASVDQGINFIMIAKYIERMADHATNIGEWAVYNVTGIHAHLTRLASKKEIRNPLSEFIKKYKLEEL